VSFVRGKEWWQEQLNFTAQQAKAATAQYRPAVHRTFQKSIYHWDKLHFTTTITTLTYFFSAQQVGMQISHGSMDSTPLLWTLRVGQRHHRLTSTVTLADPCSDQPATTLCLKCRNAGQVVKQSTCFVRRPAPKYLSALLTGSSDAHTCHL
jgi:hypothetical protein